MSDANKLLVCEAMRHQKAKPIKLVVDISCTAAQGLPGHVS